MAQPSTSPQRPLRRDAERNRQRIIDAARVVFAERGLRASHDDIAREAGVGVGTVYRRFPDKEQLIDALFEEQMEKMAALAEAAGATADPWAGLVQFMIGAQEMQSADRGLKELFLTDDTGAEHVALARARVMPPLEGLLVRAQAQGLIRRDVALTDLAVMHIAVGAVVDATRDIAPGTWRRTMQVLIDGLRPGDHAADALAVPPLTIEQLDAAMHANAHARRR